MILGDYLWCVGIHCKTYEQFSWIWRTQHHRWPTKINVLCKYWNMTMYNRCIVPRHIPATAQWGNVISQELSIISHQNNLCIRKNKYGNMTMFTSLSLHMEVPCSILQSTYPRTVGAMLSSLGEKWTKNSENIQKPLWKNPIKNINLTILGHLSFYVLP